MITVFEYVFWAALWIYLLLWVVFAAIYLRFVFCEENDNAGFLNPLSFWRKEVRSFWRAIFLTLRVRRFQLRKAAEKEIADHTRECQKELVEIAFKDPKSFLEKK